MTTIRTVLIVGATGSIGRLVTEEAVRHGHTTRALVRPTSNVEPLAPGAVAVVGDLTDPDTLMEAVEGVDAIVFTHGTHGGAGAAEAVDYGAVKNILNALDGRRVRIALMTTIGVTVRSEGHDWKRRGERMVRASGNPYTIVRPGWFDYNEPDQHALTFLQGDTRRAGDPSDGAISRRQLARVLIESLTAASAEDVTFELIADTGPTPAELEPLFAALDRDPADSIDGVRDPDNLPAHDEPDRVRADLTKHTPMKGN